MNYLFKVLQGELRLSLESGAEDTLQDKRRKRRIKQIDKTVVKKRT